MNHLIVVSGGMDSATLLYKVKKGIGKTKGAVFAISFDYNQTHKRELICAKQLCKRLKINHTVIKLDFMGKILKNNSQTNKKVKVPEGRYDAENMKLTVVPNRNMIFISIAAAYAIEQKIDNIYYGAHLGDHAIYADCRKVFVDALEMVLKLCDYRKLNLIAPFINMTKGDIARLGKKLGVPFQDTHSCYKGKIKPCGKCGACTERKEAFQFAKCKDPLIKD